MGRWLGVALTALVVSLSYTHRAEAINVDFASLANTLDSNQGTSYTVNSTLTLTARTNNNPSSPSTNWDPLAGGQAGTVFIGQLGRMDAPADVLNCGAGSSKKNCGVGVQTPTAGGSTGISGAGGNKFESLLFNFSTAMDKSSISIGLIGLNSLSTCSLFAANTIDCVAVKVKYGDGTTQTILNANSSVVWNSATGLGTLSLAALSLSGSLITQFAVGAPSGHFGVTSLAYTTSLPEPSSLLLLGAGLAGLVASRLMKRVR